MSTGPLKPRCREGALTGVISPHDGDGGGDGGGGSGGGGVVVVMVKVVVVAGQRDAERR